HLHGQQAQEIRLAERGHAPARALRIRRRAGLLREAYVHFILMVSSISCLAVDSASTMLRYWREASSISTISSFSSTGEAQTSPFSSASGWPGSCRRTGATSA